MKSLQGKFDFILLIRDLKGERIIVLEQDFYHLGRGSKNQIIIYDKNISRCHATLVKQESSNSKKSYFWLIDGNLKSKRSTNGIFVNKKLIISCQLQIGDLIHFSKTSTIKYYKFSHLALTKIKKSKKELSQSILDKMLLENNEHKRTLVY